MTVSGIFIVAAKRTPFGTYGGKFAKTSATELQTVAAKAAFAAGNVDPKIVDSVVIGNVLLVSWILYNYCHLNDPYIFILLTHILYI